MSTYQKICLAIYTWLYHLVIEKEGGELSIIDGPRLRRKGAASDIASKVALMVGGKEMVLTVTPDGSWSRCL